MYVVQSKGNETLRGEKDEAVVAQRLMGRLRASRGGHLFVVCDWTKIRFINMARHLPAQFFCFLILFSNKHLPPFFG